MMSHCFPCRSLSACNASPEQGTARGTYLHTMAVVPGTSAWLWHDLDGQLPACCSQDHNSHPGLHMVHPVTHHVSSCVIDPLCVQCAALSLALSITILLSRPSMHVQFHLCVSHLYVGLFSVSCRLSSMLWRAFVVFASCFGYSTCMTMCLCPMVDDRNTLPAEDYEAA